MFYSTRPSNQARQKIRSLELRDAVYLEDAAKPNFVKALEGHWISLGEPKKPFQ